MQKRGYPATSR